MEWEAVLHCPRGEGMQRLYAEMGRRRFDLLRAALAGSGLSPGALGRIIDESLGEEFPEERMRRP